MARVPVKLIIEDFKDENGEPREREVATFRMSFNQSTDAEGQVSSVVRGGKITMRVKALNDGNSDLVCWMVDNEEVHDGVIEFEDTTSGKIMKEIEFEDAYCVNYVEYWEDTTSTTPLAHWEEITLSCRRITNGGAMDFMNDWDLIDPEVK